jgi:RHS repeat-associated protein/uncharacterized repeat protein (TIGR01451 family)
MNRRTAFAAVLTCIGVLWLGVLGRSRPHAVPVRMEAEDAMANLAGTPSFALLPDGTRLNLDTAQPTSLPGGGLQLEASLWLVPATTPTEAVVFTLDMSGSALVEGQGCGGDFNADGLFDTVLDCELVSTVEAIEEIGSWGTVSEVSIVLFELLAGIPDLQPIPSRQGLTAPLADLDGNGVLDVETVLRSVGRTGFLSIGARQFSTVTIRFGSFGGTNFQAAAQSSCTALAQSSQPKRTIVFLSDGEASQGNPVSTVLPCSEPAIIQTVAVGPGSSCTISGGGRGSLADIAAYGGGTCTQITEPSELVGVLSASVVPRILSVTLTVDGGPPIDVSGSVTPGLPYLGAGTLQLSHELVGDATELCLTVSAGLPSREPVQVTECVGNQSSTPPVADAGEDVTVVEGERVVLDGSASGDADGDSLTYEWTLLSQTGPPLLVPGGVSPVTSVGTLDDGAYTFQLEVSDGTDTSTDSVNVTVTNAPPTAVAQVDAAAAGGVALLTAQVNDAGLIDTHSAAVDWGDGSASEIVPMSAQGTGWASLFASHVYTEPGSHLATVTITDDDGAQTHAALPLAVASPIGIWADGTSGTVFHWTGSSNTLTGLVHSNAGVQISGWNLNLLGGLEYATTASIQGTQITIDPAPVQVPSTPAPIEYGLEDYRPGGQAALAAGADYHDMSASCANGSWHTSTSLAPGLYYASCDVGVSGWLLQGAVTVVSEGTITISGSQIHFTPFYDGLLFLSGDAGQGIQISTWGSTFTGHLVATQGDIDLPGSSNRFLCGLVGESIDLHAWALEIQASDCVRPQRTNAPPVLVPLLDVAVVHDRSEALPAEVVTASVTVAYDEAQLLVPGIVGLENLDTGPVTITQAEVVLEAQETTTGGWVPIATTLQARSNGAAGVTYGTGLVGTTIGAEALASWGVELQAMLPASTVAWLLDPAQVASIRTRVDFEVDDSFAPVRSLYRFGDDLAPALRTQGNVAGAEILLTTLDGATRRLGSLEVPALALLSPGDAVTVPVPTAAPSPDPIGGKTAAAYLEQLEALDGRSLGTLASARGTGAFGPVLGMQVLARSTLELPIVAPELSVPETVVAGTQLQAELTVRHIGSADAQDVEADLSFTGSLQMMELPSELRPGQLASAQTQLDVPAGAAGGFEDIALSLVWTDAGGTSYGPVALQEELFIELAPVLEARLTDMLAVDSDGNGVLTAGDTVSFTISLHNAGSAPLDAVALSLPLDPGAPLVSGSATTSQGTVSTSSSSLQATLGSLSGFSVATVSWQAVLGSGPSVSHQGTVSSATLPVVLTDDPAAPGASDPTVTAVVPVTPTLQASLWDVLLIDADQNSVPSAGDTLRYVAGVHNPGLSVIENVQLSLTPGTGSTLQVGSVVSDQGTVLAGNTTNDTAVLVDFGTIEAFAAPTVAFEVRLTGAPGTLLSTQGTVTSSSLGPVLTDDPAAPGTSDPTETTLGGPTVGVPGSPVVTLSSPVDGQRQGAPVEVRATAEPESGASVSSWVVRAYAAGTDPLGGAVLGSGAGGLPATLGTFDPTMLENGLWQVRVEVTDDQGRIGVGEAALEVAGQMKLGSFDVAFLDAEWSSSITKMSLVRAYSTLRKDEVGDFGHGWRLQMLDFTVQTNGPLGQQGWTQQGCGTGMIFVPVCTTTTRPHLVLVRWPDGHVEAFDLTPLPGSTFFTPIASVAYIARPGATSTLAPAPGDNTVVFVGDGNLYTDLTLQHLYDPKQFLLTDNGGVEYLLDVDEGLVQTVDRNGNRVSYGRDGIFPDRGIGVSFVRDADGRIEQMLLADGSSLSYHYDAAGDLVQVVDPEGDAVDFEYDGHRLVSYADAGYPPVAVLTYDADGRLLSRADPTGVLVETASDITAFSQTTTSPDPDIVTTSTFDADGMLVEVQQVFEGHTRTFALAYDDDFRPVELVSPLGAVSRVDWDERGRPTRVEDPDGVVTERDYSDEGEVLEVRVDGHVFRQFEHDEAGNLLRTLASGGQVLLTQTFDAGGALSSWVDGDGVEGSLELDPLGQVVGMRIGGRSLSFDLDELGRVTAVTDPLGVTEMAEFDARGAQTSFTDAHGRTRRWEYDARGFLVRELDVAGRARSYVYDAAGRIVQQTTRNGDVIEHHWDMAGRLTDTIGTDAFVHYEYDALGRLVSVENEEQLLELHWDDDDRLLSTLATAAPGRDHPDVLIEYSWSPGGRLERSDTPHGSTLLAYDGRGRLQSLTDSHNGTYTWTWREDGLLDALRRPSQLQTELDWSPGRRLERLSTTGDLGQVLQQEELQRDVSGRISRLTDWAGTHEYGYDIKGQLVFADHPASSGLLDEFYAYDVVGNRSAWAGHADPEVVYDNEDRLVQDADFIYTYDGEGRQVRRERRVTGEVTTYTWNVFDELVGVHHPDGTATTYAYDSLGRRIEVSSGGEITRFGYDGGDVRMIFDGDGALASWQTTDPWGDLLAEFDPALGASRDALLGYLGTLEGWADAQGVDTIARDTFGNPVLASAEIEPHALTWHPQDPNGLVYAGARYLDPLTGRFLSQDPLGVGNLYTYALNDPVNAWDPYGLVAAVEYGSTESKTAPPTAAGSREVGLRLVCTFNEVAAIVAESGIASFVTEVVGAACSARGQKGVPDACPLCLTADAQVQTTEGTTGIAEVAVGDRVVSVVPGLDLRLPVSEGGERPNPPDAGRWRYDPRTGGWVRSERAAEAGEGWLEGGHLFWYGSNGPPEAQGRASRADLAMADQTWGESSLTLPPRSRDWVWSLDEGRHLRLQQALGQHVAFGGRIWEVREEVDGPSLRSTDQVLGRVVSTSRRLVSEVVTLTLEEQGGSLSTLTGTPEHPVWVPHKNGYVPLWDIAIGDGLRAEDGSRAVVVDKTRHYGDFEVFNVEIEGAHNYFAGTSKAGFLQHNGAFKPPKGYNWGDTGEFANVCGAVADKFKKKGARCTIRPKGTEFLPDFGGKGRGWVKHIVVVGGGRVFDLYTGPKGMPVDDYKALWSDCDLIDFGF